MKEGNHHLFFGMLANKLRVELVSELMNKPMSVTELAESINEERSKVSHALLSLSKCNIVGVEKTGKNRVYFLNKETIKPLMKLVERHALNHCRHCWAKNTRRLS
jgi:DNA-binding transcriptional ArsR family regulator